LYRVHLSRVGFEVTTLVVIGTDCIGSYESNYHKITTTPVLKIDIPNGAILNKLKKYFRWCTRIWMYTNVNRYNIKFIWKSVKIQ
jgi:hypothetical protein